MALIFVHRHADPNYIALSTDISANAITGATIKGATVYLTDTKEWKIILSDNTLGEYKIAGGTGAPAAYSAQTENSETFNVIKGNLNKFRIRPRIQNEHVESSREALGTVTTLVDVGQFFRASKDNINGIDLTLQSAETFASLDSYVAGGGEKKVGTFEYTSDAALLAEYVKTGATEIVRSAFTDVAAVTQDGSYAGKIPMATETDSWVATMTLASFAGVTFSMKFAQDKVNAQAKMSFFVGDGTNSKSFALTTSSINLWTTFSFLESDMMVTANDLTATTPDMAAITKMGFRVDDGQPASFGYADSISFQAEGGSVQIELWDFGGSALPVGDGTEDYTSDGTQYSTLGDLGIAGFVTASINLPLLGEKRKYHIDEFIAGTAKEIITNAVLVEENYMAIVLKYVDTDVTVYGADTTQSYSYYDSGYAWKAEVADNFIDKIAGAVGAGLYSDFMFQIYSTQDIYVDKCDVLVNAAPSGDADVSIFIEDSNMSITDILRSHQSGGFSQTSISIERGDRPAFIEDGGKFEVYFNDDASDMTLTKASVVMKYFFIPPTVNG